MSTRLKLFLVAVGAVAIALLAFSIPADLATRWPHYLVWTVLCALSETMWLTTVSGSGTWSMSSTACLAVVVLFGGGPAIWIASLSTLVAELTVLRKPPVRAAFNASQIAITMAVGGLAFQLLGGPAAGLHGTVLTGGAALALRLALPVLGLFAAYLIVNRCLVAVAVAWSTERSYVRVLREDWFFAERLLEDMAAFLLSPLMVISFEAIGYVGVLLFYAPVRMIYESEKRYLELRRAQDQIIHTERMAAKGEMAAEVGHELRNQLVAISGSAQMLLKDGERQAWDNVPRRAQIILEQTRRMEALSRGLMDFSSSKLAIERFDMNALVNRSIEFVRSQNKFDGVEWDVKLAERVPELRGDPGQLQQVMLNLFMNAADAMRENNGAPRVIHVTSAADDRDKIVRLVVRDTGSGIAKSNLTKIFEPHFTTKKDGHGFGLSTSHRIVANHGGRLAVESPPGEGASFTVVLPVTGPAAGSIAA